MTVKELKILLDSAPDDMQVVVSSDEEGNYYSPLEACDDETFSYITEDNTIGIRKLTKDLKREGYSEKDLAPEDAIPCVVLWP